MHRLREPETGRAAARCRVESTILHPEHLASSQCTDPCGKRHSTGGTGASYGMFGDSNAANAYNSAVTQTDGGQKVWIGELPPDLFSISQATNKHCNDSNCDRRLDNRSTKHFSRGRKTKEALRVELNRAGRPNAYPRFEMADSRNCRGRFRARGSERKPGHIAASSATNAVFLEYDLSSIGKAGKIAFQISTAQPGPGYDVSNPSFLSPASGSQTLDFNGLQLQVNGARRPPCTRDGAPFPRFSPRAALFRAALFRRRQPNGLRPPRPDSDQRRSDCPSGESWEQHLGHVLNYQYRDLRSVVRRLPRRRGQRTKFLG